VRNHNLSARNQQCKKRNHGQPMRHAHHCAVARSMRILRSSSDGHMRRIAHGTLPIEASSRDSIVPATPARHRRHTRFA
jgi:hypothetical protein